MAALAQIDELFGSLSNDGINAERENPEQPKQTGARTYGNNNVDLPEELQNALLNLMQEAQRQDLYQRRIEVMRDRLNRFYERGIQHIYWDTATGIYAQGTPDAWVPDPNGDGMVQCSQYIDDYNIFARCLQIVIAKLTENPPGVDFQPDSGNNSVDLQAAEAAESYRLLYDRRNDTKDILTAVVRMMGVSGRVITWTRTMANVQLWGTDEQGQPRRVQTTTVYGTLETKVPIMAKDLAACPYCVISEDPHIYMAKIEHPAFADKITEQGGDGMSDTQFERLARIGALQGNSAAFQMTDAYNFYVERKYGFFRPAMFMEKLLDSAYTDFEHEGMAWTLRDALNEAFPSGCLVTFIGSQYVGSLNACMDDELACDFPYAGDGMSRMAVMDPAVIIQDRFNDDMNAYAVAKDCGWPSTWVNGEKTDIDAINDQIASPYAFRAWKSGSRDTQLAYQFFREPNPEIPSSFMEHTEYMTTQLLQFILAIPSAVQGAGMPDQKTASGYAAALAQALGQLGVIWGAVQRLMAKVYRQAALAAAKDDREGKPLVIPSKKGAVTLNISNIGKGHFLAHPDVDSGYPESTVQKRATLNGILELAFKGGPEIAEKLLSSPDTWDFMFRTFGLPEIVIVEAVVRRKQLAEIEMLLQQSPIGPTPEEMMMAQAQQAAASAATAEVAGAPPQPFDEASMFRSSIQPEPFDYHDYEFEECREFLSNWSKVQQQIAIGNQAGIDNIRLHAMEHQKFMAAEAAAQMAAQAAAAPAEDQPQGEAQNG